jgi:ferredoxin
VLQYLPNVVTLELDVEKCTGCGMCAQVCPHAVLVIEDRKARITDRDSCMECGACARNCPIEALSVNAGVGCATGVLFSAVRRRQKTPAAKDACCG